MSETIIQARIEEIVVDNRIRQDLGDLTDLQTSIERHGGVLQPIGLTPSMRLVFGGRRLEAARRNGCETIAARVFADFEAGEKAIYAERDENTQKPWTALEMRAMAKRLEELVPRLKAGRPSENTEETSETEIVPKLGTISDPPPRKPRKRRDRIAAAVGTSAANLHKIDVVATAAEQPDAPPEVVAAAEEMERTGKVEPAFQAVQAATAPPPAPVDPIAEARAKVREHLKAAKTAARPIPVDLEAFGDLLRQAGKIIDGEPLIIHPQAAPDAVLTFPCAGSPASWVLTDAQVAEWAELYPAVDVVGECRKALGWIRSNTKKTVKGMPRFLTSWLGRAQDGAKGRGVGGRDKLDGVRAFVAAGGREAIEVSPGVTLIEQRSDDAPIPF